MRSTSLRTRVAAVAIAVAGTVGMTVAAGSGTASAAGYFPAANCTGLSPNVVDLPFKPQVTTGYYAGRTYLYATFGSLWPIIGYQSSMRLDWHNLSNGKRGSLVSNAKVSPPNLGVHNYELPSSSLRKGQRVRITLSAVNRNAVWAAPTMRCTNTAILP